MGKIDKFPLVTEILYLKFNISRSLSSVLIKIIKISIPNLVTNGDTTFTNCPL